MASNQTGVTSLYGIMYDVIGSLMIVAEERA